MKVFFFLFLSIGASFAQEYDSPVVLVTYDQQDKKKNSCWATFYQDKNFQGSQLTIFNGFDIPDLEFSAGPIWRENIQSIVAGSGARVTLYPEEKFQGKGHIVTPSSKMKALPWEDVHSLKLTCTGVGE